MTATFATQVAFFRQPVLETLGIASASLVVALLLGIPLAFAIARGGRVGAVVSAGAAFVRAIPELVFAVITVVAVGLGTSAGIVALGLGYAAVIAKVYAELFRSVRVEPSEALRASGATPAAAFLFAVLPLAWTGLVGFAVYTFESIVRASVIVGVVGAGGLGAYLIGSLNLGSYREFGAYLGALIAVVAVVDRAGAWLRRAPPWTAPIAFAMIATVAVATLAGTDDPPWNRLAHAGPRLVAFFAGALPPDIRPTIVATAATGVAQTLAVALAGTLGGALLALPLASLVARPLTTGWMRGTGYGPLGAVVGVTVNLMLAVARAVPPVALALIAVIFIGLGPKAGAFALVVHTGAVLAKLLAETLDSGDIRSAEALVACGSTGAAAVAVAMVPENLPALATHVLYRWEWNVRASTILGVVGAGGLGQAIFQAQQLLFYRQLFTYCAIAIVLVLVSDALTAVARRRLELRTMAR